MVDWVKVKTEYITTEIGYRKLADKYGVSFRTLSQKAKDEEWVQKRRKHRENIVKKAVLKVEDHESSKMARFATVSDKLLNRIERIIEESETGQISAKDIRSLTAAVKDLKEIQGVRSELDRQEQEARIANLRRQVDKDESDSSVIEVVFAAGPEEWNE